MGVEVRGNAVLAGQDIRTFTQQQAGALGALQKQKANALATMGYAVGGATYTVTLTVQDIVDVQSQIGFLQAQGTGATCEWEIVDGVFLTWGVADVQALEAAGMTHIQACYANAASLAAKIAAATSAADLPDVTQGWPT